MPAVIPLFDQVALAAKQQGFKITQLSDGHIKITSPTGQLLKTRRSGVVNKRGRGRAVESFITRMRRLGLRWPVPAPTVAMVPSAMHANARPDFVSQVPLTTEWERIQGEKEEDQVAMPQSGDATRRRREQALNPDLIKRYHGEMLNENERIDLREFLVRAAGKLGINQRDLAPLAKTSTGTISHICSTPPYRISKKLAANVRANIEQALAEQARSRQEAISASEQTAPPLAVPAQQAPPPLEAKPSSPSAPLEPPPLATPATAAAPRRELSPAALTFGELFEQELEERLEEFRGRLASAERQNSELREQLADSHLENKRLAEQLAEERERRNEDRADLFDKAMEAANDAIRKALSR